MGKEIKLLMQTYGDQVFLATLYHRAVLGTRTPLGVLLQCFRVHTHATRANEQL
jgi:hypothetical protein